MKRFTSFQINSQQFEYTLNVFVFIFQFIKILDLLFTNNKSSLQKIEILPGIGKSDHEIVFAKLIPSLVVFQNQNVKSHSIKPDIIIGTETWGYIVYRKDRPKQSYGGVLIAVSNDLIS